MEKPNIAEGIVRQLREKRESQLAAHNQRQLEQSLLGQDVSAAHYDTAETVDFFELDIPLLNFAWKDDIESMESPMFSIATKSDLQTVEVSSPDGTRFVRITPSVKGRATIFDKDVLIYATSLLMAGINSGKPVSNTVRFVARNFLTATGRTTSGDDYARLAASMERLQGTFLTFFDRSNSKKKEQETQGIILSSNTVREEVNGKVVVRVQMTLSNWIFKAIQNKQILTINADYFSLRKGIERRLYEIARKHCGKQAQWWISLAVLQEKCGSTDALRNFRATCKKIAQNDTLPDYRMCVHDDDNVGFIPR